MRAGRDILADQIVSYATVKEEWLDLEVDLSAYTGKTIELNVENVANDWRNEFGYWGKVEVVGE